MPSSNQANSHSNFIFPVILPLYRRNEESQSYTPPLGSIQNGKEARGTLGVYSNRMDTNVCSTVRQENFLLV